MHVAASGGPLVGLLGKGGQVMGVTHVAIYLRLGTPDQRGWLNPGGRTADGRTEYLIKPGTTLDAAVLDVLNELICTESDSPSHGEFRIAEMG